MKLFIVAALLALAVAEPPVNYGAPSSNYGAPRGVAGLSNGLSAGPAYGVPSQNGGGVIQNGPVEVEGDNGYEDAGNDGLNIPNDIVGNDLLARVVDAINRDIAQQEYAQAAAYGAPGSQQGAPIGSHSLNSQYGAPGIGAGSLNGQYGAPAHGSGAINSQYGAPAGSLNGQYGAPGGLNGQIGSGPITLIGGPVRSRLVARLRQSGVQQYDVPIGSVSSNYGAPVAGLNGGGPGISYGSPAALGQSYGAPSVLALAQSYRPAPAVAQSYGLPQQQLGGY